MMLIRKSNYEEEGWECMPLWIPSIENRLLLGTSSSQIKYLPTPMHLAVASLPPPIWLVQTPPVQNALGSPRRLKCLPHLTVQVSPSNCPCTPVQVIQPCGTGNSLEHFCLHCTPVTQCCLRLTNVHLGFL